MVTPVESENINHLSIYLSTDTLNCFFPLYEALDFKPQWIDDTFSVDRLIALAKSPYQIGLLPIPQSSIDSIFSLWEERLTEPLVKTGVAKELAASHLLNYILQNVVWGSTSTLEAACPDSASIVMLQGLLSSPSLIDGFSSHIPKGLAKNLIWTKRFYSTSNFGYAAREVPDPKIDSLGCRKVVISALVELGLLEPSDSISQETLSNAIQQFQLENGLDNDGLIGKRTRAAFAKSNVDRYGQLLANLNRSRLQSDWQKGDTYIEVNIPEYTLRLYSNDEVVAVHKVIIGDRKKHQTPSFKASLNEIVVNPTWRVPYSISTKEILPSQLKDSTYLTRKQYLVFDENDEEIDPSDIDWESLSIDNFPYKIVQQPGNLNALGTIKFLFPNRHAVYIHDTPSKKLFATSDRDYSHGCIRLHSPYTLAQKILKLSNTKVDSVALFELLDTASVYSIPIYPKIPVIINYSTVSESEDGSYLIFYNDLYKRDEEWIARVRELPPKTSKN